MDHGRCFKMTISRFTLVLMLERFQCGFLWQALWSPLQHSVSDTEWDCTCQDEDDYGCMGDSAEAWWSVLYCQLAAPMAQLTRLSFTDWDMLWGRGNFKLTGISETPLLYLLSAQTTLIKESRSVVYLASIQLDDTFTISRYAVL